MKKIVALYIEEDGVYCGLPNVDPWGPKRDARRYSGPHPVIAHPPCSRWSGFAYGSPLAIKQGHRKISGDDKGCFKCALSDVRRWGGVIEHPYRTQAFKFFGINHPPRHGGWIRADEWGWICSVEQGRYGHPVAKPTVIYAVRTELPELNWGVTKVMDSDYPEEMVLRHGIEKCRKAGLMSYLVNKGNDRSKTPVAFRNLLIELAGSVT